MHKKVCGREGPMATESAHKMLRIQSGINAPTQVNRGKAKFSRLPLCSCIQELRSVC